MSTTRRRRFALILFLVIIAACGCLALLVAVEQVRVDVGHLPEPGLRLAMADVRRLLRVRLPQVHPLRRRRRTRITGGRRLDHRNPPPDCCPKGLRPKPRPMRPTPAMRDYNAYLAELAAADKATEDQNRTTA